MKCRECQIEKRIAARGLCSTCYGKVIQKENSAVCEGCKEIKPIKAKGLCQKCYARFKRHGDTSWERKKKGAKLCSHCHEKPVHAKGLCGSCYGRFMSTGSPEYKRTARLCRAKKCENKAINGGYCADHQHYVWDDRKAKNGHLLRKYSITVEDYEKMQDKQNGVCAICGQKETREYNGKIIDLAVDHCHDTGMVRGLLCSACNIALGRFQDSPTILASALNYLNSYNQPG